MSNHNLKILLGFLVILWLASFCITEYLFIHAFEQPKYKVYYEYDVNHHYLFDPSRRKVIPMRTDTIPVDTIYKHI
jgi:hypothetical protein